MGTLGARTKMVLMEPQPRGKCNKWESLATRAASLSGFLLFFVILYIFLIYQVVGFQKRLPNKIAFGCFARSGKSIIGM